MTSFFRVQEMQEVSTSQSYPRSVTLEGLDGNNTGYSISPGGLARFRVFLKQHINKFASKLRV